MAQTKRQIQEVLAAAGSRPRHRFGQNFMIDANLVRAIADAGEVTDGDLVIEVGPGTGTLSEELLSRVGERGRVLAVEIDRDLAAALRQRLGGDARFELIEGDALAGKHELNDQLAQIIHRAHEGGLISPTGSRLSTPAATTIRLLANLPYNIASPLLVELLLAGVDVLVFTVQKEVADRLRATPADGKEYGAFSIIVQSLAEVHLLRTIPPGAFWPRPKVDSALVRLRRREVEGTIRGREREFARFVTDLFSMRRKTLRKALSTSIGGGAAALRKVGLTGEERPEQLDPAAMRRLFEAARPPA